MSKRRRIFKVGLVQLDVGPDIRDNLRRARLLCERAARRGADLICLPELFNYMGDFHHPCEAAEKVAGPSISMLRNLAAEHRVHIVAGSILERRGRRLPLNTCFLIGPDGEILARYSKMYLFDIDIPGRIHYSESRVMRPGSHATVARTKLGTFGFAICNDLRYPELFRRMISAGSEVIFLPSAFTRFTGRDHWLTLTRARAIENQCYIVAVNQSGRNAEGVRFFGSSVVVDPWGRVLKEAPAKGDAMLICPIDLNAVARLRKQLPAVKKIRKFISLKRFGPHK